MRRNPDATGNQRRKGGRLVDGGEGSFNKGRVDRTWKAMRMMLAAAIAKQRVEALHVVGADAELRGHVDYLLHASPVNEILEGRVIRSSRSTDDRQVIAGVLAALVELPVSVRGSAVPGLLGQLQTECRGVVRRDAQRRVTVHHAGLHVHALGDGSGKHVGLIR